MMPIAIIMHLRTNVPVPLRQTTQHHIPHSPQQPQISHITFLSPTTEYGTLKGFMKYTQSSCE